MSEFYHTITRFPRVVDPAAAAIELSVLVADTPRPLQLSRLSPAEMHKEILEIPSRLVHFFGPSSRVMACKYVFAYNLEGLLEAVFVRDGSTWGVDESFSCDLNGDYPTLPSLRMVFKTPRHRDTFLYYIRQVQSGAYPNPAAAQALDGLAEEIRVLDVVPVK